MHSPFPGMDPFIEAQGKWEDFHNKLIGDMERHLSQVLPAKYAVRIGERSYVDFVVPARNGAEEQRSFKPDVGIKTKQPAQSATGAQTSVLEQSAVEMEGLVEEEFRETFLEIHELDPHARLVTGIEVLSPTNKRPGTVGWYQYERKRSVFFNGHAHLIEIDLLRGGRRRAMAGAWPSSPYYILVLRRENAPKCKVWPAHFREPLPEIPIPLSQPDPDVALALQPLVEAVFDRSRYGLELDYTRPIQPPLTVEEADWLKQRSV